MLSDKILTGVITKRLERLICLSWFKRNSCWWFFFSCKGWFKYLSMSYKRSSSDQFLDPCSLKCWQDIFTYLYIFVLEIHRRCQHAVTANPTTIFQQQPLNSKKKNGQVCVKMLFSPRARFKNVGTVFKKWNFNTWPSVRLFFLKYFLFSYKHKVFLSRNF